MKRNVNGDSHSKKRNIRLRFALLLFIGEAYKGIQISIKWYIYQQHLYTNVAAEPAEKNSHFPDVRQKEFEIHYRVTDLRL